MTRRDLLPRALPAILAVLALVVLALSAPASSGASEQQAPAPAGGTTGTQPAGTTPATAPEAPPASPTGPSQTGPSTTGQGSAGPQPAVPQVQGQHSQSSSPGRSPHARARPGAGRSGGTVAGSGEGSTATGTKIPPPAPGALTPALPQGLQSPLSGVPGFFIESFQIPPFLLPIFQAAGTAYGIPWQVLAAINEVETDYGRDLSVSSAGAEGWMQFLPAEWAQYGVDANGAGFKDPYNPADAIFAAARYLRAAGGDQSIRTAVFSYNHSQAYVESVMLRAQLLGGTPPELLGAITGLTEARFPVHAAAHFSDGFPVAPANGSQPGRPLVGTTIYAEAGAPVIAVQDGEIVQIGESPALGRFVVLRDAFGNTYTYGDLGDVSALYPVLQPRLQTAPSRRISGRPAGGEAPPSGPATAGAQPRSPLSEAGMVSTLALGSAASLEGPPPAPATPPPAPAAPAPAPSPAAKVKVFTSGVNDVYLHPLAAGVQVIAGTVLGHVRTGAAGGPTGEGTPHIFFQIRPAGSGAPLIDPKPILDGWVALENSSIFRARGENPFLATSPTVGQVLLESKQQLEPQVLRDGGVSLGRCGREDVQEGRVDKRVLAMLEYLSVSGLRPTVAGLACPAATPAALAANPSAAATSESVNITAVNGVPVAGHDGQGSIADVTVRKLLMLQGAARPRQIVSQLSYPGSPGAYASPSARDAIHVAFALPVPRGARASRFAGSTLTPGEWIKLIARLGEIPDPTVSSAPSTAAIPDGRQSTAGGKEAGGND